MTFAGFLLLFALQSTGPTTSPASAAPNSVRIDALHFTYDVPATLQIDKTVADAALKSETDKATGVTKAAIGCVSIPLTAMEQKGLGVQVIVMLKMDMVCMGTPASGADLGTVATNALKGSLQRFGEGKLSPSTDYKLGDRGASFLRGSVASEKLGATIYAGVSCSLLDKTATVCWEFMSTDATKVDALAASPIHFDEQGSFPVVPIEVLQKSR